MTRPDAGGVTRSPRPAVALNGAALAGVIAAEVTNNSHFAADTYRVELAIGDLPPGYGPGYWGESQDDRISVGVSIDGAEPLTLIVGQVDDVDYDPVGRTISLSGRDLSAPLIDSRTAEKFQNRTASDIAASLAARHGLKIDAQETSTLAGTYYEIDHAALTQEQTEWDLLCYLAEREGFDAWVAGTTLHFRPPPASDAEPYLLIWSEPGDGTFAGNAVDIRLRRSQTIARDVSVTVRSWNQKQQRAFTVTAKRSQAKKSQRRGGISQQYSFVRPNLSQEQARRLAEAKAEEITRHERGLTASLPGDNRLTTRATVRLAGTATDWDQVYYPESVHRRISKEEGYRMELRAKNHSPQDAVLV